jgi:hypothetical protein
MENQILTDPEEKPEDDVLENALGINFNKYKDFLDKINAQKLVVEWNYYNDGKSWLGKILYKKKNLCWLSIWNVGFKLTFYFTEKTIKGIHELDKDEGIEIMVDKINSAGKIFKIILLVRNKKIMNDGIKLLEYKKQLKNDVNSKYKNQ